MSTKRRLSRIISFLKLLGCHWGSQWQAHSVPLICLLWSNFCLDCPAAKHCQCPVIWAPKIAPLGGRWCDLGCWLCHGQSTRGRILSIGTFPLRLRDVTGGPCCPQPVCLLWGWTILVSLLSPLKLAFSRRHLDFYQQTVQVLQGSWHRNSLMH